MNFWFCSFWKMRIKMHEIWFFAWYIYECMKFFIEYEFWKYMFTCMKFDFLFFVLFFSGAFMKEWNFLLNLNFEFEWKCMFEYIKFDFFCIWIMHLWMQESLFEYEFLVWMIMHVWVHEIWFSFVLRGAFMNA